MGLRVAPSISTSGEFSYSCIETKPHRAIDQSDGRHARRAIAFLRPKSISRTNTEDKMQIRNWTIDRRVEKCRIAYLSYLVLFYLLSLATALQAQSSSVPTATTGSQTSVHDLAMAGTVRQLITAQAANAPAGLQVVVDGPQGPFTASLGPNLSHEVQQSLSSGTPVQISGTMQAIDGKDYFLARKLTVDGNQIVIRNEYGFLVHGSPRSRVAQNNSALYRSAK